MTTTTLPDRYVWTVTRHLPDDTGPDVARELPDRIDELDHCTMTAEQIGLYQAVLDELVAQAADPVLRISQLE